MNQVDRSLAEKSYWHIHRKLSRGELLPGARLVNRTLAGEIGVSVIPVREAIHRLASEGLVQHIPGSGAFVRELSLQDLDELYILRDALESCAAEEAARHITESHLDQLESIQRQMDQMREEIAQCQDQHATPELMNRWLDCEEQFHEILIEAARSKLLSKVVREHRAVSEVFDAQRQNPKLLSLEVALQTCHERRKLLNALQNRDPELSRQLISAQIQNGRKTVLAHLRARQSSRASN
jgi:DNA-binding GntR family transcriptional regulator